MRTFVNKVLIKVKIQIKIQITDDANRLYRFIRFLNYKFSYSSISFAHNGCVLHRNALGVKSALL